jgi:hypothetical protein
LVSRGIGVAPQACSCVAYEVVASLFVVVLFILPSEGACCNSGGVSKDGLGIRSEAPGLQASPLDK